MPDAPAIDDETTVVVTAAAAVSPVQVWDVLLTRIGDWWGEPFTGPHAGSMRIEPHLGGRLWSDPGDGTPGHLHGTVRAYDPPERLEIGGVLVPGAYAGSVVITVEKASLGSTIRIEQTARGRIAGRTEERIEDGWTQMAAALAELAEQ